MTHFRDRGLFHQLSASACAEARLLRYDVWIPDEYMTKQKPAIILITAKRDCWAQVTTLTPYERARNGVWYRSIEEGHPIRGFDPKSYEARIFNALWEKNKVSLVAEGERNPQD